MHPCDVLEDPARTPPITLVGVWAHPDDETYLSAALMRRVVGAGGRVAVVTATDGALGPGGSIDHALAARRRGELRAALAELGVRRGVHLLGRPDGGCADVDPGPPVRAITGLLRALRPDLVVTFGADGVTNHPDHVAVGRWATAAWCAAGSGALLCATATTEFLRRHHDLHEWIGLSMGGPLAGTPEAALALHVRPDAVEAAAKRRALAAHASQTAGLAGMMGEDAFATWWVEEAFRYPTAAELAAGRALAASSQTLHGDVCRGARTPAPVR